MNQEYVKVYSCNGQLDADMIKIFLESMQINAIISRESVGGIYGLSVGPLGEVDILVPREQYDLAVDVLTRMENGEFEVEAKDEIDLGDLEADDDLDKENDK